MQMLDGAAGTGRGVDVHGKRRGAQFWSRPGDSGGARQSGAPPAHHLKNKADVLRLDVGPVVARVEQELACNERPVVRRDQVVFSTEGKAATRPRTDHDVITNRAEGAGIVQPGPRPPRAV